MENTENTEKTMLTDADPETMARAIVQILEDQKARDVKLLAVRDKTVMADYFVICTGTSNTQIRGIAGALEFKLSERGLLPLHTEGYETGRWIVYDYAHVMVHIFCGEEREFFKLEKLWGDAEEVSVESL